MGKSLRSKVKQRWRGLKKNYLHEVNEKPLMNQISKKLEATIIGVQYRQAQVPNAFLHPQEKTAVFPQYVPKKNIDLRSSAIPNSGREYSGASRKYMTKTVEEKDDDIMHEEIKIDRSLIKKDKKKSKLRKQMVF